MPVQATNRTTGGAGRPAWMRPTDSVSLYQGRDRVAEEAVGRADRELRDRSPQERKAGGAR